MASSDLHVSTSRKVLATSQAYPTVMEHESSPNIDMPSKDPLNVDRPKIRITDFTSSRPEEEHQRTLLGSQSTSRSRSLLKRLGTISSPRPPIDRMLTKRRTKGEKYDRLGDEEADIGDMPINVDLSSLAGASIELADIVEQPTMDKLQPDEEGNVVSSQSENLHGLGHGMVIGAQLNVDPSSTDDPSADSDTQRNIKPSIDIQRAKTIRQRGQQEAEKRQVIVAVQQAVDLSSYEGIDSQGASTIQPASTYLTSRRTTELAQSYYYPPDPARPNWKPFSMRSPYILLLIVISIGLSGVQEWLCQRSMSLEKVNDAILKFNHVSEVTTWNFFCWKYLPTLIFVSYGVFWQIMDFDIRRLEPFYQLSKPNGSTAEGSLNLDYLTMWSFFVPWKAFRYKQWAVLCSSIGTLLATSLSASLQNPSVAFVGNPKCEPTCPEGQDRYFVRIQPVWSRFLSASLLLTAMMGILLFIQLRRKSGLLSDPKGIAGIASMATKSHILNDFQGLDSADEHAIHKRLQHRRYVLYKSSIWQGEYIQHSVSIQDPHKIRNPHPMMLRMKSGWLFIGFLTVTLFTIPIVNFTPARVIPNSAPWLPVLVATCIKMLWSTLDYDVRMLEPFKILSQGSAKPNTLTLDYRGTPYGMLPIKAFLDRHYLVSLVGFGSILSDVLTVTVSAFSVNGEGFLAGKNSETLSNTDETFKSFWGSVILSILIVSILIFSACIIYLRRGRPFLPRQPSTIASILAFIFASNMLFDFVDTEHSTGREVEKMLEQKGKKYGLGWFTGFDKKLHVAIDEMPWKGKFDFGRPHDWVQPPWSTTIEQYSV